MLLNGCRCAQTVKRVSFFVYACRHTSACFQALAMGLQGTWHETASPLPLRRRDPSVTCVGFAWDSADSRKMAQTFKWTRDDFGCFLDLQAVATRMGYHGCGLAALTQQVMGFQMAKDSLVSC